MIKKISAIVLVTLLLTFPSYAHTAEVKSEGEQPYKAVRLTPEVYRNANPDLSDLRVRDSKGKDIPYFIQSSEERMESQSDIYPVETLRPEFTVAEDGKETLVHIKGLSKLNLCDITIETDTMFKRFVSSPLGGGKELYNLTFDEIMDQDLTLPIDGRYLGEEDFTLQIRNYDDAPIEIKNIVVSYYVDEVVFAAGGETDFTLYFGDVSAVAPIYDITAYKDAILQGDVDRVSLGEVVLLQPAEETPVEEPDYTLIFNIVILLTAVFLGAMILLRLKKKAA